MGSEMCIRDSERRGDLKTSMQRKTANNEAWQPKCAAPRLGYEPNQEAKFYCAHRGSPNKMNSISYLALGTPGSRPTNTTHHPPTFQFEAIRQRKTLANWVARYAAVGRWVWVTSEKHINIYPGVNNKLMCKKIINNQSQVKKHTHTSATTINSYC